eukprot:432457_1
MNFRLRNQTSFAVDLETNKLYLSEGSSPMIIIGIKTKQFHTDLVKDSNVTIPNYPCLVNANGTTHIIGGSGSSKHLTWNDTNNSFKEMHDFGKNGIVSGIHGASTVYVPPQKIILMIGGIDAGNMIGDILDIRDKNNFVFKQCSIKCPMNSNHPVIRSGGGLKDELLVTGWIKHLFNSTSFNNTTLPSSDILQLILMFYYQETIQ